MHENRSAHIAETQSFSPNKSTWQDFTEDVKVSRLGHCDTTNSATSWERQVGNCTKATGSALGAQQAVLAQHSRPLSQGETSKTTISFSNNSNHHSTLPSTNSVKAHVLKLRHQPVADDAKTTSALMRESASEDNGARNKWKTNHKNKNKEEGLGADGDMQAFEIKVWTEFS